MRLKHIIFSLLLIQLTGLCLQAAELGQVAIAGNGCFGQTSIIQTEDGRYILPLRVRMNKKSETAFDRKTCNIRVPVKVEPNEKVQILDVSQVVRVLAQKDAVVKSSLNVSLVGKKTGDLIVNVNAVDEDTSLIEIVKSEKSVVIAESDCGRDTMLTGNLNILATGAVNSFASTGSAQLTLKVLSCDN